MTNTAARLLTAICAAAFAATTTAQRPGGTPAAGRMVEWRDIGGDKSSTRYSPIDQINVANIRTLQIAWRRPVVAEELRAKYPDMRRGASRATPVMIRGVLYAPNAIGLVEAFDAASGSTVWMQQLPEGEPVNGTATRAVAYWSGGAEERLYVLRNAQLWALDAKTGRLVDSFGNRSRIDLKAGLGPLGRAGASWNFAPFVCNDVVIVGVSLNDNIRTKQEPPGVVQAFDVRTGKPRWTFNPVPRPGQVGNETWENDSWAYSGSANVWSFMSADEELGYVYLPTGSPTSDMYGGHRLGNNLFSNSIVCVQCATGRRVWHFQTIHHDLWDWDNNVAPILADIVVNGKPVKAVVQLTKQAMAYVLDRTTGLPVWPIEERPVPPSTTAGERASATQPFPSKPAPSIGTGSRGTT